MDDLDDEADEVLEYARSLLDATEGQETVMIDPRQLARLLVVYANLVQRAKRRRRQLQMPRPEPM